MRNTFLKDLREEWKGRGRFFYGKTKVMAKSLGLEPAEAYQCGLDQMAQLLRGQTGLFFTNADPEEVQTYFQGFVRADYARGGSIATETFSIPAGPVYLGVDACPPSMEPQLRQLNLPSNLKNGA